MKHREQERKARCHFCGEPITVTWRGGRCALYAQNGDLHRCFPCRRCGEIVAYGPGHPVNIDGSPHYCASPRLMGRRAA